MKYEVSDTVFWLVLFGCAIVGAAIAYGCTRLAAGLEALGKGLRERNTPAPPPPPHG